VPQNASSKTANNVLLIHGAFADGGSWSKVIPLLQAKGLRVTSIQLPLTSFAEDLAAARRVLAIQDGPVILVGHSYGGVVVTEVGNDAKVVGLVYVSAYAPGDGETILDVSKDFPKSSALSTLKPQPGGFLLLSDTGIKQDVAQDLNEQEKMLMIATQPLTSGSLFEAKVSTAAWKDKPSWYIVSTNDRMIAPEQEKSMAKRMNASTTVLSSSHIVMLSHPREVADIIVEASEGRHK
jgi:pimeloyl-ACP methyl ester carboxylesterase